MDNIKKDIGQFYIGENPENSIAKITFFLTGKDKITIDHTYVSDNLKGQGIGHQLVEKVVEFARQENKKIIPVCSFAKKIMTQNEEYADVLFIQNQL